MRKETQDKKWITLKIFYIIVSLILDLENSLSTNSKTKTHLLQTTFYNIISTIRWSLLYIIPFRVITRKSSHLRYYYISFYIITRKIVFQPNNERPLPPLSKSSLYWHLPVSDAKCSSRIWHRDEKRRNYEREGAL